MDARETNTGWARRVVADKAWLLHTQALVIGPAEEFFDGHEKVHVSDLNGEPVTAPVVKLATGHVLLAEPNAFVELEPREVAFYQMAASRMAEWMKGAVAHGAENGIPADKVVPMLTALLRAQLLALGGV